MLEEKNHGTQENTIDFVTIHQQEMQQTFGDLCKSGGKSGDAGLSNQTRGILLVDMETHIHLTIQISYNISPLHQTGNGVDFGDLAYAQTNATAFASSVRGVFAGGSIILTNKIIMLLFQLLEMHKILVT